MLSKDKGVTSNRFKIKLRILIKMGVLPKSSGCPNRTALSLHDLLTVMWPCSHRRATPSLCYGVVATMPTQGTTTTTARDLRDACGHRGAASLPRMVHPPVAPHRRSSPNASWTTSANCHRIWLEDQVVSAITLDSIITVRLFVI